MDISDKIYAKATIINDENRERALRLNECKRASICPKCGDEVDSEVVVNRIIFSTVSSTRYTCKNCGRIYYF